jgi:josephin
MVFIKIISFSFINKVYYNLDSKLDAPEEIGSVEDLSKYLSNLIKSKDKELFVIVTKEVESDDSWKNITSVTNAPNNNT